MSDVARPWWPARRRGLARVALAGGWLFAACASARAQAGPANQAAELEGVGVDEQLGDPLPRELTFTDASGETVRLGDLFDGERPLVLNFAYHRCPVLCDMILSASVRALRDVPWTVGDEFDFVSVSIDPRDDPSSSSEKLEEVLQQYGTEKKVIREGWHFLTADQETIDRVTDAAGFRFTYNAAQDQYGHPSVLMLLTPDGELARYLYGLSFAPGDVRLGLLEASKGRNVSTVEQVIIYCYRYDPEGGKYTAVAENVMRVGGGLTLAVLGGFIGFLWLRERRKRRS